jgi:hypothetical protein
MSRNVHPSRLYWLNFIAARICWHVSSKQAKPTTTTHLSYDAMLRSKPVPSGQATRSVSRGHPMDELGRLIAQVDDDSDGQIHRQIFSKYTLHNNPALLTSHRTSPHPKNTSRQSKHAAARCPYLRRPKHPLPDPNLLTNTRHFRPPRFDRVFSSTRDRERAKSSEGLSRFSHN